MCPLIAQGRLSCLGMRIIPKQDFLLIGDYSAGTNGVKTCARSAGKHGSAGTNGRLGMGFPRQSILASADSAGQSLSRSATLTDSLLRTAGSRPAISAVSGGACQRVVLGRGATDTDQSLPSYLKDTLTLAR